MALWSDPRFSDTKKRMQEQRLDDAFERDGISPGMVMVLGAAFGLVLLAAVIGLGHPETPTQLADRTMDQPAQTQFVPPAPRAPAAE